MEEERENVQEDAKIKIKFYQIQLFLLFSHSFMALIINFQIEKETIEEIKKNIDNINLNL